MEEIFSLAAPPRDVAQTGVMAIEKTKAPLNAPIPILLTGFIDLLLLEFFRRIQP
ncbi:hypothetical protein ACTXPG_16405 [Glutamicibacter arilaitensis]|uniref:hypothetical protein n=1 Tax=Glutamicibacter arilaitensis TaxID=256701 RepID=UPI003FD29582